MVVFNAKYDKEGLTSPFDQELQAWRDRPNSSMLPHAGVGDTGREGGGTVDSLDADADADAGEGSDDEKDGRFQWMIEEEAEVEAEKAAEAVAKAASVDHSHSVGRAEDGGRFYTVLAAAFGNHQNGTSHLYRSFLRPAAVEFGSGGDDDGNSDADMPDVADEDCAVGRVHRRRLREGATDASHGASRGKKRIYGLVSGGAHAFAYGTTVTDGTSGGGRGNEPVWEVEMDVVGWAPYDPTASSIIEMYYEVYLGPEVYHAERHVPGNRPASGSTEAATCTVDTNGFTYTINFGSMTQTNSSTKRTRAIRRSMNTTAGATDANNIGGGKAGRRTPGFQRPLEEVAEWAGYPSRQCPHPGCQGESATKVASMSPGCSRPIPIFT